MASSCAPRARSACPVDAHMADVNVSLLGGLAVRYPDRFYRHADPLLLVQINEFTCSGFTVAAPRGRRGVRARGVPGAVRHAVPRRRRVAPTAPAVNGRRTEAGGQLHVQHELRAPRQLDMTVPVGLIEDVRVFYHQEKRTSIDELATMMEWYIGIDKNLCMVARLPPTDNDFDVERSSICEAINRRNATSSVSDLCKNDGAATPNKQQKHCNNSLKLEEMHTEERRKKKMHAEEWLDLAFLTKKISKIPRTLVSPPPPPRVSSRDPLPRRPPRRHPQLTARRSHRPPPRCSLHPQCRLPHPLFSSQLSSRTPQVTAGQLSILATAERAASHGGYLLHQYKVSAGRSPPTCLTLWRGRGTRSSLGWIRTTLAARGANSIAAGGLQAELIQRPAAPGSARCRARKVEVCMVIFILFCMSQSPKKKSWLRHCIAGVTGEELAS
ncbi:hypothetical protein ZWY2020_013225 [Hordeum vulgare]|nr:hypothetical protein ZWY2020_013225 [Hordeum vulgare]